ncbi:MAG: hypothetical protein S4CHLAM6_00510 [Chlamydiae bacterium]|nr:hypothetical protein [Chlamydiota bacterium]
MLEKLSVILEIQEFDIKMIRLMKLKKTRKHELEEIESLKKNLRQKIVDKTTETEEIKLEVTSYEDTIKEIKEKIKKFESQQDLVKKIEEFNALNQEISRADRERANLEHKLNAASDQLMAEEDSLAALQTTYDSTSENSKALEEEIYANIAEVNKEGITLKEQRDLLVPKAEAEIFAVYEKLINNKRNRVVVAVNNRCCSGCHIALTAQQENLVRKGERIVFCEHCSRILYWAAQAEEAETTSATPRRRRRKIAAS